jgi:hypothetical protein
MGKDISVCEKQDFVAAFDEWTDEQKGTWLTARP